MNLIESVNLKREFEELRKELEQAFHDVMNSGQFILGPQVRSFEFEFAHYCNVKYCIGVGNGFDAIRLALRSIGISKGDEVIVPSNTYIATWLAISETGAKPIPVEPDLGTYNLNPDLIPDKITERTKAIIPVHLYGQPAELDKIILIAHKHGLKVIDDAAQAHGSEYHNMRVGAACDMSTFSFYPTKNLGAYGDGGCITTNNDRFAERVKMLRNYGESAKYENRYLGINSRLDELQAAFLRVKLKYLDDWVKRRRILAQKYLENLRGENIILPNIIDNVKPSWHQFVIRVRNRDKIRLKLRNAGISTHVHYPIPPYRQQSYLAEKWSADNFPVTEQLTRSILSLPISHFLDDEQVDHVISTLNRIT